MGYLLNCNTEQGAPLMRKYIPTIIKINDAQYIELFPGLKSDEDRLHHIAIQVDSVQETMDEWQRKGWRAMGTGGYFSRGALFGAGAIEVQISNRTRATGSLSHSYSMRQDDLSTALGLQKSRTDASGGLSVAVRPDISVYGNVGRTISAHDNNSATFLASAGVLLRFK